MKPLIPTGPAAAVSVCFLACASASAQAGESARKHYDIPRGDAVGTLKRFADESGRQVVFLVDAVRGITTNAVGGDYTVREALRRLVADTGLVVVEDERSGALMVNRTASAAPPPSNPNPTTTLVPMKKTFPARLSTAFLAFPAAVSSAQTPPPSAANPLPLKDEAVVLSPFTVDTSKDYGYRRTNAITATRIGMPIIDTPLNIQVIGADFLKDLGVDNIQDAFRYTSGVTSDAGNEFRPSLRIRGFSPNSLFRDGFLRYYNFDIDGIEQIEIVKGPNAVFFGRTAPGGIINYTTKKPQFTHATRVETTLGDHAYYKGLIDTQGTALGGKLAARIIASKVDAESWLDEKTQKKDFVLANVIYRPLASLELYAALEHTNNYYRGTGAYGMVYNRAYEAAKVSGASPAAETKDDWRKRVFATTGKLPAAYDSPWFPRGYSFNKNGHGSFEEGRDTAFDLQAKWKLAEHLNLRVAYNHLRSQAEQGFFINGDPGQTPYGPIQLSNRGDPAFGATGPTLPANNSISSLNYGFLNVPWFMVFDRPNNPYLQGGNQENRNKRHTYQADLTYDFELFKAKHTFVASFDQSRDRYYRAFPLVNIAAVEAAGIIPGWSQFFNPAQPMPYARFIDPFTVNFASPSFGWYPLDVKTLNYGQIPDLKKLKWKYSDQLGAASYFAGNRRLDQGEALNYQGAYFDEKLHVMAGLRHSTTESIAYNEKGDKGTTVKTSHTTPMVGANYRVASGVVLFASYNKSFQVPAAGFEGAKNPVVTNPVTKATSGGEGLPVEQGKGYDVGLKTDYLNNLLSGTVSLFRVDRKDILVRDTKRETDLQAAGFDLSSIGSGFQRPSGLQRVEGLESDFIYTPLPNYQILASATWSFTRTIVNADPSTINKVRGGTYDSGIAGDTRDQNHKELAGVPEWQFSVFNKYTFREGTWKGLGLGAGFSYETSQFPQQELDFGFRYPSFYLVDALVTYRHEIGRTPVNFALNVNNVLDKHYSSGRVGVGAPLTWKLSASVQF
ncbi:MAG: TonB-dependent receptor [Undibacterium sp.]|nr:TonB-dependent receptor [Opitutaceae bacterium]